jgi:hypothetical protein
MEHNGQSGTVSSSAPPEAGFNISETDSRGSPSIAASEQCLRIVEQCQSGEISTADATMQFCRILPNDDRGESAIKRFIERCTEIDVEHATAAIKGKARVGPRLRSSRSLETEAGTRREEEVGEHTSDEFQTETVTDSSDSFRPHKRRHSDADASDTSARSSKRPDHTKFSWRWHWRSHPHTSSSAMQTLSLKANHLLDLKAAKNDLVSQLDCPNFPDHLWLDVLANRYVDLDKVFSGYYSLESDHRITESFGNVDITLLGGGGPSKPAKTVESHGDWSIAFAATKHAIFYVYPHRADELAEYEEFIIGLFTAVWPAALHYKVINLDKAIVKIGL